MKTYLWIEDREGKSSYIFWKTFIGQLCPEIIVESKKNNSELVKAVRTIEDDGNKYIIIFDNSFDNLQAVMEQKRLKTYVNSKKNVFLLDLICFEYTLLEFSDLIKWIYAPNDEFLIKRKKVIAARENLVRTIQRGELNYKDLCEIVEYNENVDHYNVEQLSARILFDLTRNTGFEVSKGNIGECWIKSCCEWGQRESDDICGLDTGRLQLKEKMEHICRETSLLTKFQNVGLEVVL